MNFNWRKPIIYTLLYLSGSKIPRYLREIQQVDKLPFGKKKKYQEEKLNKLLLHAYKNVPYYHTLLEQSKVVVNRKINLNNFGKIPYLTKEIIRKEGKNLCSKDYKKRNFYENTSGGSTGIPVKFIQDKQYWHMNIANKFYFNRLLGKDIGEKEINLWGSERDILKNTLPTKEKIINFLYNRLFLNAFKINDEKLSNFVLKINKFKPVSIWTYVESIDLLAKFIENNNLKIYSPKFIISTAGTLFPEIKKRVEGVFQCPVYNQYGSREVGPLAVECHYQKGLHYFPWSHKIELAGKSRSKEIIITDLKNYSMPLIRYKIGDIAIKTNKNICSCGRKTLLFKEITGRVINHFKTKNGSLVHGQYFIHQLYFRKWIKKFQIVQKKYDEIIIKIIPKDEVKVNKKEKQQIVKNIKLVMGNNCQIKFEFVKSISPSKSGKYLYTICNIK